MREPPATPNVVIRVRVTPRGGCDTVLGVRNDVIHIRVAAPPVEGAANRACAEVLAEAFGLRRAQVLLVGGERSRDKRFALADITADEAARRIALLPPRDTI